MKYIIINKNPNNRLRVLDGKKVIGIHGRTISYSNYANALQNLKDIAPQYPDAILTIIPYGNDEDDGVF